MIGRIPYTEIAKEAGVNVKTLYRVLNNEPLVKETTRKRIIDALNRNGCFEQRVTAAENVVFDVMKSPYQERQAMALLKRLSPDRFHCSIFNAELEREKFLRQCPDDPAEIALPVAHGPREQHEDRVISVSKFMNRHVLPLLPRPCFPGIPTGPAASVQCFADEMRLYSVFGHQHGLLMEKCAQILGNILYNGFVGINKG